MRSLGGIFALLIWVGCDRSQEQHDVASKDATKTSASPSSSSNVAATNAPDPSAPATEPAAAAPTEDPTRAFRARLERYASWLEEPDLPECTEGFGINASIGWPSQPSRLVWLTELARVEPELIALTRDGGEMTLGAAVYGPRNYGRSTNTRDLSRSAIVVTCGKDHLPCRAFAGLYSRIEPGARPRAYCGAMPGRSGGDMPVHLDQLLARPRPHPHGTCARYRACLAERNEAAQSCDGFESSAARCAEAPDCTSALACFAAEPRNPKKPLWSDAPGPSGPLGPGLGF